MVIWKFYHKFMNNQLLMFFSSMNPQLTVACARYELRNPMSHLPIMLKIQYVICLIRQLNSEVTWAYDVPSASKVKKNARNFRKLRATLCFDAVFFQKLRALFKSCMHFSKVACNFSKVVCTF